MDFTMRPPGISHLSQELIDEILDHLQIFRLQDDDWAERDAVDLKTISLVSRIFRPRSQKHLFTHIGVHMTRSNMAKSSMGRLKDIFSTNPRLASHVRILALRIRETGHLSKQSFSDPHFIACLAHILHSRNAYPSLPDLQIYLTTKVANSHRSEAIVYTHWSQMVDACKAYFIPTVVMSRLTSIEIRGLYDVPIALFDNCHNLTKLNVFKTSLAPFEESKRIPIEKRPLIRELWVAESEALICHTGFRFDNLERLVFQGPLTPWDIATMEHIFTSSDSNLSSLEYLNLFLPVEEQTCNSMHTDLYLEIGVDFARMPNLRELKLKADIWWPYSDEADPSAMFADFLSTFPAKHNLQSIHIFFDCFINLNHFSNDKKSRDVGSHLRTGNWAAFDSTIAGIASAAQHSLELSIMIEYSIENGPCTALAVVEKAREKDKDALEDWGMKYLPRTNESPNVVMDVITRYKDDREFHTEEEKVGLDPSRLSRSENDEDEEGIGA